MVTFSGTLTANETGGSWVVFPYDPKDLFGSARAPVVGTINGTPFRSRLAVYGGVSYLGVTKALRAEAGLDIGSVVEVSLEHDSAERAVAVPAELDAALAASPAARTAYEALSFTHQREYAVWVGEGKKEETRSRRATHAIEMLTRGKRHP